LPVSFWFYPKKVYAQPRVYFTDNFERENVFNGNWELGQRGGIGRAENFTISEERSSQGSRSLKIHNAGGNDGLQAINHVFEQPLLGIVSVDFYEYGYQDNRSAGTAFSVANKEISRYLIFAVKENQENFVYRIQDQEIDSGIKREKGWHTLTIVVTQYGSYGKIDGRSLAYLGVNSGLREIGIISLGRGWQKSGDSFFDNLQVRELIPIPQNQQEIFDHWSDEVYRIYKDFEVNEKTLRNYIKNQPTEHSKVMAARLLSDQAMMHFYYYVREGKEEDLNKAKILVKVVNETYDFWGKRWLSPMPLLGFDVWWMWNFLDGNLQNKFLDNLAEEADFWTNILNEIKTNPDGKTISKSAGRREGQNNLSLIDSSRDYKWDTRAEENGSTALLLALAYNMYSTHPHSEEWNEAAKCFAFHTFSQGETACGITTRTIGDNFILCNHNLCPSPMYTLAGVTELQQGQLFYLLAGKTPPREFYHHIEEGINSPVWQKNLTECGFNPENRFEIAEKCHAGLDWGDRNFLIGAMMVAHWAKLDPQSLVRQEAEELLQQMLQSLYYFYHKSPWYPRLTPISFLQISSDEEFIGWFKNLEVHPQESAKFLVMTHYNDPIFKTRFFPLISKFLGQDLNGDGRVDGADVKVLLLKYNTSFAQADFNQDGIVSGFDFVKLLSYLNREWRYLNK